MGVSQPVKNQIKFKKPKKKKAFTVSDIIKRNMSRKKKPHPKYGTSKLEDKFAKEFLDKLGVEYERQFEAKEIGRFYDFIIRGTVLIEIDGDFYHGYGLLHEEKNYQQKKAEYVDKIKDEWALANGYPIYRIWEHDINNNPQKVMDFLKKILYIEDKKKDKKKRH